MRNTATTWTFGLTTLLVLWGAVLASAAPFSAVFRSHATDCSALTEGHFSHRCYEQDSQTYWQCRPTDAAADGTCTLPGDCTCDTPGEWKKIAAPLPANGSNASSGNAILGVDANGAAEGAFDVWTEAENTAAAYAAQATTMTVAGTANQITSSAG